MRTGLGLMAMRDDDFWAQPLKSWLLRLEGWASQYDDGVPDAPTDEEHDALAASYTPEQRAWLGLDKLN